MSTSIYDISRWDYDDSGVLSVNFGQTRSYLANDIILYSDSNYYYALRDIAASTVFSTTNWGGVSTYQAITKPTFIWTPSPSPVNHEPKIKSTQFGDGYEQRGRDGLNNLLLVLDFGFEGRSLQEATAILHFLNTRAGAESFYFTPLRPYNRIKKFVCKSWNHQEIFVENHVIRARFEERAN